MAVAVAVAMAVAVAVETKGKNLTWPDQTWRPDFAMNWGKPGN